MKGLFVVRKMLSVISLGLFLLSSAVWAQGHFDVYGPTAETDRLWQIARAWTRSPEVTPQQTMMAIFKLNPRAFNNNNVNGLRQGVWLKMPDTQAVQRWSALKAELTVASHNQRWATRQNTKVNANQNDLVSTQTTGLVNEMAAVMQAKSTDNPAKSAPQGQLSQKNQPLLAGTISLNMAAKISQLDYQIALIQTELHKQFQQTILRIDVLEDENVVLKNQLLAMNNTVHRISDQLNIEKQELARMVSGSQVNSSYFTTFFSHYGDYFMVALSMLLLLGLVYALFSGKRQAAAPSTQLPVEDQFDDEEEEEYDFLNSEEGIAAKLDLARAYIDMGDHDTARQVLHEVRHRGKPDQKQQAEKILDGMSAPTT